MLDWVRRQVTTSTASFLQQLLRVLESAYGRILPLRSCYVDIHKPLSPPEEAIFTEKGKPLEFDKLCYKGRVQVGRTAEAFPETWAYTIPN
jgi:hypothetical protein